MHELDLSRSTGCNENPVALLLKVLDEGAYEEFIVITKKTILPLGLTKIIASRRGYTVEVLREAGDEIKLKFKKSTYTPPSNL
ncbi:MAG: hypothetical protein QXH02_07975 [Desulfurococcaceae archaeon]